MSASWKLSLPCTRAEAEAIADVELGGHVAVMTTEEDEATARWRLDAYFEGEPDAALVQAVRAIAPSAAAIAAVPEPVADADWLALSQAGLEPVRAGRFFVHTAHHADAVPPGTTAFHIEASRAFGTGHHETTAGCLMMLDAMRRRGALIDNLVDLGTGTGLLAFAAMHLWPRAWATATDIDPVAIEMVAENAAANGVAIGSARGRLATGVADGIAAPLLIERAPYDLVIANILAAPLIEHARAFAAIAAPGGQIVLAGLLNRQAESVARAYRREGCRVAERLVLGDWTILRLRRRPLARPR